MLQKKGAALQRMNEMKLWNTDEETGEVAGEDAAGGQQGVWHQWREGREQAFNPACQSADWVGWMGRRGAFLRRLHAEESHSGRIKKKKKSEKKRKEEKSLL